MTISEFWEADNLDLYNFIRAKKERMQFDIEQQYDYTRLQMWASLRAMSTKDFEPSKLIPLSRDKKKEKKVSKYDQQRIKKWSLEMDKEMKIVKPDLSSIKLE